MDCWSLVKNQYHIVHFPFVELPQEFILSYRQLVSECGNYQSVAEAAPVQLTENMLIIIEEGMQLFSESAYVTEYSLLCCMRRDLTQHLRLLLYGVNDCTIPPVALHPYIHWSTWQAKSIYQHWIDQTVAKLWIHMEWSCWSVTSEPIHHMETAQRCWHPNK